MLWGIFAITFTIWLAAIAYIVRGWGEPSETGIKEIALEGVDKITAAPESPVTTVEIVSPHPEQEKAAEIEIEIPIVESPSRQESRPSSPTGIEGFYQKFGRANVVEFPAEYVGRDKIRDLSGNSISIVEFAKNCYREIGFQCIDSVMTTQKGIRTFRVNIFDLVSDHYAKTDEEFIDYFGRLKERFTDEIQSIAANADITPRNRRVLVGRYDGFPQLVAWNDRELFLVTVKSRDEALIREEIDFLNEFVVEKGLFKANVFRVTEKREKVIRPAEEIKGAEEKPEVEREAKKTPKPHSTIEETPPTEVRPETQKENTPARDRYSISAEDFEKRVKGQPKRKAFTKAEIRFLKENKDKMTNEELAAQLGRSIDSVTHKLSRLNIARETYEWTSIKDDFLRNNIIGLTYRQLAERLGTTIPSVRARCKKLNINK